MKEQGDGPRLLVAHSMIAMPSDFDDLLSQLARDHSIVTYDPRGAGRSSRTGPYDITTDAEDMAAIIEAAGHSVVAVSLGFKSDAVVEVMLEVMESDPQGLLRTLISMGNPQLSDAGVRERVEQQLAYGPPEVGVERSKSYLGFDGTQACAALGSRLRIVSWESPLAPPDAIKRVRQRLPDARIFKVKDGPISRPELTAEIVRQAAASIGQQGAPGRLPPA